MNNQDKKNPKNWSKEETDRVVAVFEWLFKEDRKQNPDLYKKPILKSKVNDNQVM